MIYRNVPVQYFSPARPLVLHKAMVIAGDAIGVVGEVFDRSQAKGPKSVMFSVVTADGAVTDALVPVNILCRVADPDVLHVSEFP
jgi:hypothetical protein